MNRITVSPSSFAFLYDECPACFYLDAYGLQKRPRTPFPTVFAAIDVAMKRHFEVTQDHRIDGLDHSFRIESQGKCVRSRPFALGSGGLPLAIRGVYDSILTLTDGARVICDFKTSPIKAELVSKYSRQLQAYALAVEQPESGRPVHINRLGLAVFAPEAFAVQDKALGVLQGNFRWLEVERDDIAFIQFLGRVSDLLSSASPPAPSPTCAFCRYRDVA